MHTLCNTLESLSIGESGQVKSIEKSALNRRRLLDMGLVPGCRVQAVLKSPTGNVTAYLIKGALIAIRDKDAKNITIQKSDGRSVCKDTF